MMITLNQQCEYEQCHHPTEQEIKKSLYTLTHPLYIASNWDGQMIVNDE